GNNLKILFQILLAMKLSVLLILLACLQLKASVYAQQVSLSLQDAPLEEVIKELRKQTNFAFFYDARYLQQASSVSLNVKNVSMEVALSEIFKEQQFTWEILNKTILIKPIIRLEKREGSKQRVQTLSIKGEITDVSGRPLPGVSVSIKGTSVGTVSNA